MRRSFKCAPRFSTRNHNMFSTRRAIAHAAAPIVTAIVSAFFAISTAAAVDTITVCQLNGTHARIASFGEDFQLSRLLALPAGNIDVAGNDSIALTRDERGFDLILNWHQRAEHSLRAAGVDVLGMELGSLIHLMVPSSQERVEQYLFNLDEDGSGDLLWNSGASQRDDDTSVKFACAKPR
jgi:hypothetical protein